MSSRATVNYRSNIKCQINFDTQPITLKW